MSIASPFLNLSSASGNTDESELTDASDRNPEDGEPGISREAREPSISVLVVDADPSVRLEIAKALRVWGFRSSEASTEAEALNIFHMEHPEAVILSLDLPDGSGLVALRRIRYISPETIVIVILERSKDETYYRGASEASAFVTKPIDKIHLGKILRSALGQNLPKRAGERKNPQREPAQRRGRPQGKAISPLGRLILSAMKLLSLNYNDVVTASRELALATANPAMRIGRSTLGDIISGSIRQPSSTKLDTLRIILHLSREEIDAALGLHPERRLSEQLEMTSERTHEIKRDVVTRQRKIKIPILRRDATLKETGFLSGLIDKWAKVEVEYLGSIYPPHLIYVVVGEKDTYSSPIAPPGSRLLVNTLLTEVRPAKNLSFHERELFCVSTPHGVTCAYLEQSPGKIVLVPHPLSGHVREQLSQTKVTIIGQVVGIMFPR
jgi:DNA-binding response OmpR family regulator